VEVVASLSQGRTVAAQCGLFTYKSVPVIFKPPCTLRSRSCCLVKRIETLISLCQLPANTTDTSVHVYFPSKARNSKLHGHSLKTKVA